MQVQNTRTALPYTWERFTGRIPQNAVYASDSYVVIRAYHANDWITGKLSTKDFKAYLPYDEKEVQVSSGIEILVPAPGTVVEWVQASHGQVPQGAVGPFGKDNVFVGRAICPRPESVYTPGKIHPSHKSLYIPFDGKEINHQTYEACVIRVGITRWERFHGRVPEQAVYASNKYVVIRAYHAGNWVPGKLSTQSMKAYIAYDMKEVEIGSNFEVLLHAPGTEAKWIPSFNGTVPAGAIGPFGADGVYIGRAMCPQPESVYTPGKIHPAHQCLYMPFDGKENSHKNYEALVIEPVRGGWKSAVIGFLNKL